MEKESFVLPPQYRDLCRVIGMDATIRLCKEFGGSDTYIPKVDALIAAQKRAQIRREWTGHNAGALARKYEVSVRWIRKIVEGDKLPPIAGQISVDDFI